MESKLKGTKGTKETKETKESKPKKLILHLVPVSEDILSTRWTLHIHRIMKMANPALLKRNDVILAFNQLVDILITNQQHVYSFFPNRHHWYNEEYLPYPDKDVLLRYIIEIKMNSVFVNKDTGSMVMRHRFYRSHPNHTAEEEVIIQHILDGYRILYDLICADAIPYMKQMRENEEKKVKDCQIQRLVDKIERVQAKYEVELERRYEAVQRFIDIHTREIAVIHKEIARISGFIPGKEQEQEQEEEQEEQEEQEQEKEQEQE